MYTLLELNGNIVLHLIDSQDWKVGDQVGWMRHHRMDTWRVRKVFTQEESAVIDALCKLIGNRRVIDLFEITP